MKPILILLPILISGCVVEPYPGTVERGYSHSVREREVIYVPDDSDSDGDHYNGRYHCPPGQAKKGNCKPSFAVLISINIIQRNFISQTT